MDWTRGLTISMAQFVVQYIYIYIDDIPKRALGQFWNIYHICVSDGKGDFFTLFCQSRCATRNEHELIDMTEDVCYRSNPFHSAPEVLEPQPLGNSEFGIICES